MKVKPPVKLEENEVCHRLGRPPNEAASHQPRDGVDARDDQSLEVSESGHRPGPRPNICKFASWRTKARVMVERKSLKPTEAPVNDCQWRWSPRHAPLDQPKIYMANDLTRARAKLAYLARELKRSKKIANMWVFDCRVMIKTLYKSISGFDCGSWEMRVKPYLVVVTRTMHGCPSQMIGNLMMSNSKINDR